MAVEEEVRAQWTHNPFGGNYYKLTLRGQGQVGGAAMFCERPM
jgi:hypothetical protein